MFKKTRRKIVASIMAILMFIWIGTLGIIYVSSYIKMTNQNYGMLKTHAAMYDLSADDNLVPPQKHRPQDDNRKPEPRFVDSPMFKLSTFYTVAFTYDGELIEINNNLSAVQTDEQLEQLAREIISSDKISGNIKNLSYYVEDKGGYMLVAFMDNTVVNENALTLFKFTLVFGAVALIIFFFLSVYLARRIVTPLEESYEKQKQFISDAGHELKTPVSVVSANAELLSREIGENQWLSNIQYENERMGTLVGQLLELARTENVTPVKERVDFSHLVDGEILPFESVAYEKGVELVSSITKDVFVDGNVTGLKQLISILLDNAIRHSNKQGKVKINLIKENNSCVLSVVNAGNEIAKEDREKIFERFYRVDSARNSEDKHYGLGLAIAKAITISHNGKIGVKCYDGLVEFFVKIPMIQKL